MIVISQRGRRRRKSSAHIPFAFVAARFGSRLFFFFSFFLLLSFPFDSIVVLRLLGRKISEIRTLMTLNHLVYNNNNSKNNNKQNKRILKMFQITWKDKIITTTVFVIVFPRRRIGWVCVWRVLDFAKCWCARQDGRMIISDWKRDGIRELVLSQLRFFGFGVDGWYGEVVSTLGVVRNQPSLTWRLCATNNKSVTLYVRLRLFLFFFLYYFYIFFCSKFKKTKKKNKNVVLRVISIHYHTEHQLLLLTYKHRQFHWTRGASKLGVFCFFFVLFSSSFSPSVKGVPLPMGKSQKKKRCCEDWTRLFNEKNEKNKQQQPKELMRNPVAITMKITELWQTIPFLSRKEKKKRRIYFKLE